MKVRVIKLVACLFLMASIVGTACENSALDDAPAIPEEGAFRPDTGQYTLPAIQNMPDYWLTSIRDKDGYILDSFTYYPSGHVKAYYTYDTLFKYYFMELYEYDESGRLKRSISGVNHNYNAALTYRYIGDDTLTVSTGTDIPTIVDRIFKFAYNDDKQVTWLKWNKHADPNFPKSTISYEDGNLTLFRIRYYDGLTGNIVNSEYEYNTLNNPYESILCSLPFYGLLIRGGVSTINSVSPYIRSKDCVAKRTVYISNGKIVIYNYTYTNDIFSNFPLSRTKDGDDIIFDRTYQTYHYMRKP